MIVSNGDGDRGHGHGHGHGLFIKTRVTEKFTPFPRRVPAVTRYYLNARVSAAL
jgi:hypothetical protein